MATDINEAFVRLAERIQTVDGLRAKSWMDDSVNPDEVHLDLRQYDPRMTLGGSPVRPVGCKATVYLRRQSPRAAQEALRDYIDKIIDAVEDSDAWTPDIHYAEVILVGDPFQIDRADMTYLAVELDIDVVL